MARKHGHGSIYQRSSDGRIIGRLPDGRGGHRHVSRPDVPGAREEVRRELDAMRRERDRTARSSATVRGGERLRDLVAVYLATVAPKRVRARTIEGYRQIARDHVVPILGSIRVAQLDAADAQLLVERMTAAGYAPTTVRNAVVFLSAVLRQAMRDGIVDRNVASLAVLPKRRQQTLPSLTTDQVAAFIEATRGERFWPVWTIAATTGMRISEVLGLRWEDVKGGAVTITGQNRRGAIVETEDGPMREWHREQPKTEQSRRTVHLPPLGVEALSVARSAARSPVHVFARSDGGPVERSAVTKAYHKALTRCGLPSVRFHSLRHSAASGMLDATGGDIRAVSAVLGHRSINTTIQMYGKEADEARQRAAEAWGPARAHAARFGAELARAMAERGISNKVLRQAAGIGSTSNVSEWRNGHNLPGIDAATRMADALRWPRLLDIVREARTRPCTSCGRPMIVDAGRPRRYCSPGCRDITNTGGPADGTEQARTLLLGEVLRSGPARKQVIGRAVTILEEARPAERVALAVLRTHQDAIADMCHGCVVDDLCRTPECPLRAVSPLPLSTDEREAVTARPAPSRWDQPGQREAHSEQMRRRHAARPELAAATSARTAAAWDAMTPEQRAERGRAISVAKRKGRAA